MHHNDFRPAPMHYQIIQDLAELERFVAWLPDLREHETFYCCLFARKKYAPDGIKSSDKVQLKRFTSKKENLIDKIRQLECPLGAYKLKDGPVPPEGLVFYINPNPRCMKKAAWASIRELSKLLEAETPDLNTHQEVMSCIQRAQGRKVWVDFDFDLEDKAQIAGIREALASKVNADAITFVETRGGVHVLIETARIEDRFKKSWYPALQSIGGIDQIGDQLLPVPGCVQGGFVPKLL
jgi:hypothetical protein